MRRRGLNHLLARVGRFDWRFGITVVDQDVLHGAVKPESREHALRAGVVVNDLALDPVVAGEVEAEFCVAIEYADGDWVEGVTDVSPAYASWQPASTRTVARLIPAAPTRRAIRRRGDSFTIDSCMFNTFPFAWLSSSC